MSKVEESGYVEDAAADWDIASPILSTAFKNITRDGMESAFSDFLSHGDVGWRLDFLESFPRRVMEQVHRCAATKQTGVTLQDSLDSWVYVCSIPSRRTTYQNFQTGR